MALPTKTFGSVYGRGLTSPGLLESPRLVTTFQGDPDTLAFFVPGVPQPQGSMKAFPMRFKNGPRAGKLGAVMTSANPRLRPWRDSVIVAAREAMGDRPPITVAVTLSVVFTFARPRGHFGARGLLPSAPRHHIVWPDVDKLCRGLIDALTEAGVYRDDSQVVGLRDVLKVYGDGPGAAVTVQWAPAIQASDPSLPGQDSLFATVSS